MLEDLTLFEFEGLDPFQEPSSPAEAAALSVASITAAYLLNKEQSVDQLTDGQLQTVMSMILMGSMTQATVKAKPSIVDDGLEVAASLDAAMTFMVRMEQRGPWVGHFRNAVSACRGRIVAEKALDDVTG